MPWVGLTVLATLVQGIAAQIALHGSHAGDPATTWPAVLVIAVSQIKWALVAIVLVMLLRRLFSADGALWRAAIGRQRSAVFVQRYSVMAFGLVAVLTLTPGPNILDQLPDGQRQWLDSNADLARYGGAAAAALALLVVAIFILGRWRSDQAWRNQQTDAEALEKLAEEPPSWIWLLALVLWPLAGAVALAGGHPNYPRLLCSLPSRC